MNSPKVDPTYYSQSLVGKLIFFTNMRLDIAFATNLANIYMQRLEESHLKVAKSKISIS
jgi:hypothetical protein